MGGGRGGTKERTLSLERTVRQFESVVEFATLEGKQRRLRFERHAWTLRGGEGFEPLNGEDYRRRLRDGVRGQCHLRNICRL